MNSSQFCRDLAVTLARSAPIIHVATADFAGAMQDVRHVCRENGRDVVVWTMTRGFHNNDVVNAGPLASSLDVSGWLQRAAVAADSRDPGHVMASIRKLTNVGPNDDGGGNDVLFVLVDYDLFCGRIPDYGHLVDLLINHASQPRDVSILVLSATSAPKEMSRIADHVTSLPYPPPTVDEVRHVVETIAAVHFSDDVGRDLAHAVGGSLCGLPNRTEVESVVNEAMVLSELDASRFAASIQVARARRLAQSDSSRIPGMKVVDPCLLTNIDDLAGMNELQSAVKRHLRAFTPAGEAHGLSRRAGCIIAGPPGTGKTSFARACGQIANDGGATSFPVIEFEFDALFGGLLGDTEKNSRRFWDRVNEVSPCIVIIDEAEKLLSGTASSYSGDGGAGQRLFRHLIANIEDGKRRPRSPYFVLTMNRPDLIRQHSVELFSRFAGGFFYVDLPDPEERLAIFRGHLKRWLDGRDGPCPTVDDVMTEDVTRCLRHTASGFSGRDLVAVLVEAQELGDPWPTPNHVIQGVHAVAPSITTNEEAKAIRDACVGARVLNQKIDTLKDMDAGSRTKSQSPRRRQINTQHN